MRVKPVVAAILFYFFTAVALPAQSCQPEPRQITVHGTSDIFVEPDEAVFNFGVSTEGKTVAETASAQDQTMRAVLRILREAGIADKDIQTGRLGVEPRHNDKEKLIGYKASQSLSVTLRELAKYEDVSKRLLEGGVTNVYGIDFRLKNPRRHADQARLAAVRAAREKASAIAAALGVKIGKPLSVVEEDAQLFTQRAAMANTMGFTSADAPMPEGSTISSGQVRVRAKVTIRFELE